MFKGGLLQATAFPSMASSQLFFQEVMGVVVQHYCGCRFQTSSFLQKKKCFCPKNVHSEFKRKRTNGRSKARHKYNYLLNRLICGKGFIIINFRLQQQIITSVSQSLHSMLHLQSLSILYLPRLPAFHWSILRKRIF